MTKKVRIENADNAIYKVKVETWEGDKLVGESILSNPCDMADFMLWQGRHLVIKELT